MTEPHAINDIRTWADRVGLSETYLSPELASRMGRTLRLIRPALEPLRDWLNTPVEGAVFEAVRQAGLRFHPRVTERYLRLQDMWPEQAVSLGGLFLLRILEEQSFANQEITRQLSVHLSDPRFQNPPQAMLNPTKSAEIDVRCDALREQDWTGPSLFGERRKTLPEADRPMGRWVREAFGSFLGEVGDIDTLDRQALALVLVDEASPEMPPALAALEARGWRKSTLLAFLLKENVSHAAWADLQRHHIRRFGQVPGAGEPILSIGGYFDFLAQLVEALDQVHLAEAMRRDTDFQAALVAAYDAAPGWQPACLPDLYRAVMTRTDWKHPESRRRALAKARQSLAARLTLGRRLVEAGLRELGDRGELDRFLRALAESPIACGPDIHVDPFPEAKPFAATQQADATLYCLAMDWVSTLHARLGIKDAQRVIQAIELALDEFTPADADAVREAAESDPGVILDVGGILHWGTLEGSGEQEDFARMYRQITRREGWFHTGSTGNFAPALRIIERSLPSAGLFF